MPCLPEKSFRPMHARELNRFLIGSTSTSEDDQIVWEAFQRPLSKEDDLHSVYLKNIIPSMYELESDEPRSSLEEFVDSRGILAPQSPEDDFIAWMQDTVVRYQSLTSLEILRSCNSISKSCWHRWNLWYILSRRKKWKVCSDNSALELSDAVFDSRFAHILCSLMYLHQGNSLENLIVAIQDFIEKDSFISLICTQKHWNLAQKRNELAFDRLRKIRLVWMTICNVPIIGTTTLKEFNQRMIQFYDRHLMDRIATTPNIQELNFTMRKILDQDPNRQQQPVSRAILAYLENEMNLVKSRNPRPPVLSDLLANFLHQPDVVIPIVRTNLDLIIKMSQHPRGAIILYKVINSLSTPAGKKKDALFMLRDLLIKAVWNHLTENLRFVDHPSRPWAASLVLNYRETSWECCICFDFIARLEFAVQCLRCKCLIHHPCTLKIYHLNRPVGSKPPFKCPQCRLEGFIPSIFNGIRTFD